MKKKSSKTDKTKVKSKKRSGLFRSIQTKVIFFLVLLTTVILVYFGLYQIFKINEELDIQLTLTNQNTAKRLSNHIELAMWTLDRESVNKSIESEFLNKDIYAIAVNSAEEGLYVGLTRDDNWKITEYTDNDFTETLRSRDDLIASTKRISHKGGGILGDVVSFSTKRYNEERIQQQYKNQAFVILTIGLILILVTFVVLQFFVINPMRKLSEIARQMSRGNYFENLEAKSGDEIGELSSALNMLNKSYQVAREQVKST
ncbi:MAG: HAMP domain-containing protein [Arenicella sp.]